MSAEHKRIAFVLPDLSGGGAERVALTLIDHFVRAGYMVDLVLARAEGELLPLVPDRVRVIDLRAKRFRNSLWPLVRYLRQKRPDAIQVSMWPLTVLAIIARMIARVRSRLVLSDHAILSMQYPDRPASVWLARTVRRFYPRADARIAVSAASARDLARLAKLPESSFEVIANPISPQPATLQEKQEACASWPVNTARILTVGSLIGVKKQALLISALAKVSAYQPASLVILGEGECRQSLEQAAAELGLSDRVAMPGFVMNPTAYYENANLFVLPSEHEAYSLALAEALAAGLPIVSTDCGGPRDILDDGRFGRLIPVGDVDALASTILDTLREGVDPEVQKARAAEMSAGSIARYQELLFPDRE